MEISQSRDSESALDTFRLQLRPTPVPFWEILPEELAQGEGSDDENDYDHPKRVRTSGEPSHDEEVILDLEE
jgi:hypothetical protein